ncbi:hypothetical protein Q3G72_015457 [Acer saccharum]|nr:hypothetical protein Q3G72_015457 [Acer saccharum]
MVRLIRSVSLRTSLRVLQFQQLHGLASEEGLITVAIIILLLMHLCLASGKVVGIRGKNEINGGDVAKADGIFASINFNSIVTLDIDSGRIAWAKQLGDYDVFYFPCLVPDNPDCPPGPNLDADFGEAPMLLTIYANGTIRDVVVAVQKSGFAWALNRDNGEIVWFKLAGPGGEEGGGQWGAATDGR